VFALRFQQIACARSGPGSSATTRRSADRQRGRLLSARSSRRVAPRRRPILDKAVEGGRLRLPHDNMWLGATALMSGTAAAVGTPEQRALLYAELAPFARAGVRSRGGAASEGHHWLGKLASRAVTRGGDRHFDRAESMSWPRARPTGRGGRRRSHGRRVKPVPSSAARAIDEQRVRALVR